MYKYTYLLSDSYRGGSRQSRNEPDHHQPSLNSISPAPFSASQRSSLNKAHQRGGQHQQYHQPLRQGLHELQSASISLKAGTRAARMGAEQHQLENRLGKLASLGERHDMALREADLQNKLNHISGKYAAKRTQPRHTYQHQASQPQQSEYIPEEVPMARTVQVEDYRRHPQQLHSIYSFSRLQQIEDQPQSGVLADRQNTLGDYRPSFDRQSLDRPSLERSSQPQPPAKRPRQASSFQRENEVPRHSVKAMIGSHLSKAERRQEGKLWERPHHQLQGTGDSIRTSKEQSQGRQPYPGGSSNERRLESVLKLSSLQERIRSSLKPYLDS